MTSDAVQVLVSLFHSIWSLFTCFKIPGTNVTPASWALYTLLVVAVLRFIPRLFGADTIVVKDEDK